METTTNNSTAQATQTYTARELATLLDADIRTVFNAKYNKRQNVVPGTKRAAVLSGMASLGITWDQIVLAPTPVPVKELTGTGIESFEDSGLDTWAPVPEAGTASKDIPETPAVTCQAEDGPGTDMSLEDIFGELWRRLPGAAVIVTRQE